MARRRVYLSLLRGSHSRHRILFLLLLAQPDLQLLTGRSCVFYIPLDATIVSFHQSMRPSFQRMKQLTALELYLTPAVAPLLLFIQDLQ